MSIYIGSLANARPKAQPHFLGVIQLSLLVARGRNIRRVLRLAYMFKVTGDLRLIADRALYLHFGAALPAVADVNPEEPGQHLSPAVILDLPLIDGFGIKALPALGVLSHFLGFG